MMRSDLPSSLPWRSTQASVKKIGVAVLLLLGLLLPSTASPLGARSDPAAGLPSGDVELVAQLGGLISAIGADERHVYVGVGPRLMILDT
jgi:hypothetical protein